VVAEMAAEAQSSRRLKVWAVILGLAILAIAGVYYVRRLESRSQTALSMPERKQSPPDDPDSMRLSTVSVSNSVRSGILGANFDLVYGFAEIPAACKVAFESSFVNSSSSGSGVRRTKIQMADPGERFNWSDNVISGLALRRLIFAGLGPKTCFVYYERGGTMYPSACLAVMDYAQGKSIWVGESRKKAANLRDLRSMISNQKFQDTLGPVC